jgi:membrane-associated protease RseP (regulator of RpoE activity)
MNPDRSIVFVAFTGEEHGQWGANYYTTNQKQYPPDKCIGMLNLDTVGRLGKNKLLVLGAGSAKEWVYIFRGAGAVAGVEVETVHEELDSSDQKSFWKAGVPAVQFFSGPHADYHKTTDVPEKIDPQGLVKVASIAKEVIEHLAGREHLLTATLNPGIKTASDGKRERKVSLGTIPDFAYSGGGYRIAGIVQGSPAEKAGLKEGDIIIKINASAMGRLKDLSDFLKSTNPGEKVTILFLRDGQERTAEAGLVEK